MPSHEIRIDRALFSDEVVSRAAHRYSGAFFVEIRVESAAIVVLLTPKMDRGDGFVAEEFQNDLLDEKLRDIVRKETSELQTVLIKAALNESLTHTKKVPG